MIDKPGHTTANHK